jgi:hypothetical protein
MAPPPRNGIVSSFRLALIQRYWRHLWAMETRQRTDHRSTRLLLIMGAIKEMVMTRAIVRTMLPILALWLAGSVAANAQYQEKTAPNGDYVATPATVTTSPSATNGPVVDGEYGKTTLNGNYVPSGAPTPSGTAAAEKDQPTIQGEYGATTLNGNYVPNNGK